MFFFDHPLILIKLAFLTSHCHLHGCPELLGDHLPDHLGQGAVGPGQGGEVLVSINHNHLVEDDYSQHYIFLIIT